MTFLALVLGILGALMVYAGLRNYDLKALLQGRLQTMS